MSDTEQMTLILKHANKNRLGTIDWGPNDFDVCESDRCIGRIFLSPQSPPGSQLDVDHHCAGISTVRSTVAAIQRPASKLWRFQSAVAKTVEVIYETLDAPEEYLPQWACECLSGFL